MLKFCWGGTSNYRFGIDSSSIFKIYMFPDLSRMCWEHDGNKHAIKRVCKGEDGDNMANWIIIGKINEKVFVGEYKWWRIGMMKMILII